jgi:DNA polymerase alpha subunit A
MSKSANARARFAELRALRESGKKRTYEVQQEDDLYEEVDEEGYKKVVRERLNQDDFVIDDNGDSGYADDGREDWDRRPNYDTESEEDLPVKGKNSKAGRFINTVLRRVYTELFHSQTKARRRKDKEREYG